MIDQPTSPEYEGRGCPNCDNDNADGDIYLHDVEYDGDELGVSVYLIWICEQCKHMWSE
jgi:hypothetical protein